MVTGSCLELNTILRLLYHDKGQLLFCLKWHKNADTQNRGANLVQKVSNFDPDESYLLPLMFPLLMFCCFHNNVPVLVAYHFTLSWPFSTLLRPIYLHFFAICVSEIIPQLSACARERLLTSFTNQNINKRIQLLNIHCIMSCHNFTSGLKKTPSGNTLFAKIWLRMLNFDDFYIGRVNFAWSWGAPVWRCQGHDLDSKSRLSSGSKWPPLSRGLITSCRLKFGPNPWNRHSCRLSRR